MEEFNNTKFSLFGKLSKIQKELDAPKDKFNEFGGYKYRSAESILEALKPLLEKYKCSVTLNDDIVLIGGTRFYVKAYATLTDTETGEQLSTTAYAREEESKKGMDASQVTGAASSYARKYALNGLFAIDDGQDADSLNTSKEYTQKSSNLPPQTMEEVNKRIGNVKSRADLASLYKTFPSLHNNEEFKKAMAELGQKFPRESK